MMSKPKLPKCPLANDGQGELFAGAEHIVEWRKQYLSTRLPDGSPSFHIVAWCQVCARGVSGGLFPSKALFSDEEKAAMPALDGMEPVEICPICNTAQRLEQHHLAP